MVTVNNIPSSGSLGVDDAVFVENIPSQFQYEEAAPPFVPPQFDMTDANGDGLADADTSIIASHCFFAIKRLATQFQDSSDLKTLICLIANRIQRLELEAANVLSFRSIATAYRRTLDNIGRNIGQARAGDDDDTYRRFLTARGLALAAVGSIDEILAILVALDNGDDPSSISIEPQYPAAAVCHMTVPAGGHLFGERAGQLLKDVPGAGVRKILLFEERDTLLFTFEEDGGPTPPAGTGFAEEGTPTAGGHWGEGV